MSESGKPQCLGSLGSGQDRLRGRGRGRGTVRKFAPTVAPRRATGNAEPGSVKSAIPKLLEVIQRPEVEQKPIIRNKKHLEPAAPTTVTFVASDVKKSSFVPNDRSLRTTSAVSYPSTPSGSPVRDNEMDIDEDQANVSNAFSPIMLPFSVDGRSSSRVYSDIELDDVKVEEPVHETKKPANIKDIFETGLRLGLDDSEFIFWQLPSRLPIRTPELKGDKEAERKDGSKSAHSGKANQDQAATSAKLPDGFLGKLVIHKSGKIILKCGGVDLLVNSATQYPYRQELMALNLKTNSCNRLATVNHRVVCSPDLSTLDCDFSDMSLLA